MPDRIDIDALLIGALYGELTPADETLLTAHLESHPADRTALADLVRTRAAVRDSHLLEVQLEPPQAISALLLQEASRRAPRPAARGRETASWFQRFARSFMAHPAMAAAAMLVLVVGVAGTFYLHGTALVAEPPAPELSQQAQVAHGSAPPKPEVHTSVTTTPLQGTEAPAAEPGGAPADDRVGAGSAVGAGAAAGSDGDRVGLDDDMARVALAKRGSRAGGEKTKTKTAEVADRFAEEVQAPAATKHAAPPPTKRTEPRAASGDPPIKSDKKLAGIVVRTPELSLRELKESEDEAPERARPPSAGGDRDVATAEGRITRGAAGASGGAPPAPAPAMPEPAPSVPDQAGSQPAPAFESSAVAQKPPRDAKSEAPAKKPAPKPIPTTSSPRSAAAVASPPPPANVRFAGKAAGPAAKDTAGPDKALIDWARKRHEQVKMLVSSNNCRAAASAATEISTRAPDYYAANVVTDRTIKPCLPYIQTEREREDRIRAAKNAAASDSSAPASPPARK